MPARCTPQTKRALLTASTESVGEIDPRLSSAFPFGTNAARLLLPSVPRRPARVEARVIVCPCGQHVAVAVEAARDGRHETVRPCALLTLHAIYSGSAALDWSGPHMCKGLRWALRCCGRMMSDYDVTLVEDNTADMYVIFHGPKDSACHLA